MAPGHPLRGMQGLCVTSAPSVDGGDDLSARYFQNEMSLLVKSATAISPVELTDTERGDSN
jgi:hypothetical protein